MNKRLTTTMITTALLGAPLGACGSSSNDGAVIPGVNDAGVPASNSVDTSITVADTSNDTATPPTSTTTTSTTTTTTAPPPPPAPTDPPPAPTNAPVEIEYLRQGDESPRIATMQRELITLDLLPAGSDSGVFDSATNSALRSFQSQWGLGVDGVFGPETDRALTAAAQSVASE